MKQIDTENTRAGSPLKGKLALDRNMHHAATRWAAAAPASRPIARHTIKCALPYEPWEPGMTFPKIKRRSCSSPRSSDTIAAVAQNAKPFYMSVPEAVSKYYVEFTGASHYLTTGDQGTNYDVQSKYIDRVLQGLSPKTTSATWTC